MRSPPNFLLTAGNNVTVTVSWNSLSIGGSSKESANIRVVAEGDSNSFGQGTQNLTLWKKAPRVFIVTPIDSVLWPNPFSLDTNAVSFQVQNVGTTTETLDPFGLCPPCGGSAMILATTALRSGWRGLTLEQKEWTQELVLATAAGGGARIGSSLRRIGTKIENAIRDHMRPRDFMGLARDARGLASGGQHLTETLEAAAGLRRQIHTLRGVLANPNITAAEREEAMQLLSRASSKIDEFEEVRRLGYYNRNRIP